MQISHDICNTPSRLLEIRDAEGSETQTKRMAIKLLDSLKIDDADYRSNDNSCKITFILNLIVRILDFFDWCTLPPLLNNITYFLLQKELFEEESKQKLKVCYFPNFFNS